MTVCFTGHRPEKISGWAHSPEVVEQTIRRAVAEEIVRQSEQGAEEFISGMAPGFDLWHTMTYNQMVLFQTVFIKEQMVQ